MNHDMPPLADQATYDIPHLMNGGTDIVPVEAVFHVPAVHPAGSGPWLAEADKIAWRDRTTGLDCIIRRSRATGCLEGFVAVPPSHPLFGLSVAAIVAFDLRVHGGVTYAAECQRNVPEDTSVCHVPRPIFRQTPARDAIIAKPASPQRLIPGHGPEDDAWWFGFSCDKATDLRPDGSRSSRADRVPLGISLPVYRDENFVYRECLKLAHQLHALSADGHTTRIVSDRQLTNGKTEG
ncbi:hypothetical protein [Sphingomonas sanguinis]|uniref:Uncharacterized protein n=1 Tax=Sphingomonas sanguinis TaxID=33051 RepID=A0A7Y7QXN9_9SPHN|nr:hypothetical protein [Sphingomonas sanguinis]MBZ6383324.1 hypothetical protein [Sphingomonas sanguinis]NNG48537.1 hypothetical protein [Sphingomonas sanguinis]NNG54240.1 hypothetical protein [Sphingomonas sanguinis]NVP32619.1 hypothetical protein [Sphingomonas sanguinis]